MKIAIIVSVAVILLALAEMYRELHSFQVKDYILEPPILSGIKKEKKIVFLSDLHNQVYGNGNEKLIRAIEEAHPDFIFVGGDMLVGKNGCSYETTLTFMKQLPAICPVYYANGNHEQRMKEYPDDYIPSYQAYRRELEKSGIHFLENETITLLFDDVPVKVTGLEIPSRCYTHFRKEPLQVEEMEARIGKCKGHVYHVLMAHNPSYVQEYKAWGADLILSGHLHGGMVRLPWIGGVIAPSFTLFPRYSGDIYRDDDATVVVSKGLGTHTICIRLFNPAELVVLHIRGA